MLMKTNYSNKAITSESTKKTTPTKSTPKKVVDIYNFPPTATTPAMQIEASTPAEANEKYAAAVKKLSGTKTTK